MKKRGLAVLLSLAMAVSAFSMNARAEAPAEATGKERLGEAVEAEVTNRMTTMDRDYALEGSRIETVSGNLAIAKPTKTEIYDNYMKNVVNKTYANKYAVIPSVKNPYTLGTVHNDFLSSGLGYLNFARYSAGLNEVSLNAAYNTSAQTGAVLMASGNKLTQQPAKPANMDNTFYNNGIIALTNSNIGYGFIGYSSFIQGSLNDGDPANVVSLGHRRWLLNPAMGQTGFGYAEGYYTQRITDNSGAAIDYNFISWPASGNFPSELLPVASLPWSITMNTARFKTPVLGEITVTINRNSDNKKVILNAADSGNAAYASKEYLNVNTNGFGVPNCISFRPGTDAFGTGTLKGVYHISVQGLKDIYGNTVILDYEVEFFSAKDFSKVDRARVGAFVERLYQLCLGRNSDPSGFDSWVNSLAEGRMTGASIGKNFVFSNEYLSRNTTDDAYIKMLYRTFLGREFDQGGLNYWKACLGEGVSRTYILKGFIESKEYAAFCKNCGIAVGEIKLTEGRDLNLNITRYVRRIYSCVLEREADIDGLNLWSYAIYSKSQSPAKVAISFINSAEFASRQKTNEQFVEILYKTYMGRGADVGGKNYWVGELNRGRSRAEVSSYFASSKEFQAIVAQFGIK